MALKIENFLYKQSQTELFQGTKRNLGKKLSEGFNIVRGGNGSWVITKPSVAEIVFETQDGRKENMDVKDLIRENYGKQRVTQPAFEKFKEDVETGKLKLKYEDGKGVMIEK